MEKLLSFVMFSCILVSVTVLLAMIMGAKGLLPVGFGSTLIGAISFKLLDNYSKK